MTEFKTSNIEMIVLQAWHIFTGTRTIAMLFLICKIVLTCKFFDIIQLNGSRLIAIKQRKKSHIRTYVIVIYPPEGAARPFYDGF